MWLVEVRDGATRGEARLVKPDLWRVEPMGLTAEGSFYYGVNTITRHVYVATVDVGAGEVLAGPVAISQGLEGANTPRWSPDGHTLAFRAKKMGNGVNLIALWSPDTGETAELEPRVDRFGRPLWRIDNRFLLMEGRDASGRPGLFSVDAQSGFAEPLENFWGVNFASPFKVSRDGMSLFTTVWLPDGGKALQVRPLEGGQVITLFSGAPQGAALSPDGERVAFVDFREGAVTVNVVPSDGGPVVELFSADEPGEDYPGTVTWSPDGMHLVFVTHPPGADQKAQLVFLPVNGGEAETRLTLEFTVPVGGVRNLQFSPDGRRIAFGAGSGSSEVWVMENFLPGR
jgi:Tol biopolymer transport system component